MEMIQSSDRCDVDSVSIDTIIVEFQMQSALLFSITWITSLAEE